MFWSDSDLVISAKAEIEQRVDYASFGKAE